MHLPTWMSILCVWLSYLLHPMLVSRLLLLAPPNPPFYPFLVSNIHVSSFSVVSVMEQKLPRLLLNAFTPDWSDTICNGHVAPWCDQMKRNKAKQYWYSVSNHAKRSLVMFPVKYLSWWILPWQHKRDTIIWSYPPFQSYWMVFSINRHQLSPWTFHVKIDFFFSQCVHMQLHACHL